MDNKLSIRRYAKKEYPEFHCVQNSFVSIKEGVIECIKLRDAIEEKYSTEQNLLSIENLNIEAVVGWIFGVEALVISVLTIGIAGSDKSVIESFVQSFLLQDAAFMFILPFLFVWFQIRRTYRIMYYKFKLQCIEELLKRREDCKNSIFNS